MTDQIVKVALPLRLPRLFDYLNLADGVAVETGMRVLVPFRNRQAVGIVQSVAKDSDVPRARLRRLVAVLEPQRWFSDELWSLLHWASDYYHYPLGEVLFAALPAALRQKDVPASRQSDCWGLTPIGQHVDPASLQRRAPVQARVLSLLADRTLLSDQVAGLEDGFSGALRRLEKKGWVTRSAERSLTPQPSVSTNQPELTLTEEQANAVATVQEHQHHFRAILLEGVTGSGKTEVYLRIIAAALQQGGQALMLVPEIGLTPQLRERFVSRFGNHVAVVHSGLTHAQRLSVATAAAAGEVRVVVGTRSAIFTPFEQLGVICIDEEHDLSYKQADGFRYSARDLGVRLAQICGIPILLGSATPSLESLRNVQLGRYTRAALTKRAGAARPPSLLTVDLRRQKLNEGLSSRLISEIDSRLKRAEQSLLFLNRRGFAPVMMCHFCGWHARCERCDANQTYHQTGRRLQCHHCGSSRRVPARCPDCGAPEFKVVGEGTQRLEQLIQERFPDFPVLRVDRDSTRRKGSLEAILAQAASGEPCILIGTQMLAKGHDLPKVTLAALVNVDQALFSADFRATERLAQMVVQVAGRSGRSKDPGIVVLQTWQPDHPVFLALREGGYRALVDDLMQEREHARLPPFAASALVRSEATARECAVHFLNEACDLLAAQAGLEVLGPAPAPMEKRAGRHRQQILILASDRRTLHAGLSEAAPAFYDLPSAARTRWSLDIDPLDLS